MQGLVDDQVEEVPNLGICRKTEGIQLPPSTSIREVALRAASDGRWATASTTTSSMRPLVGE